MRIVTRLLILGVLSVGLGFATLSSNRLDVAAASRCCQSCPGGGDPTAAETYCVSQCPPNDAACFQSCADSINNCFGYCTYCHYGTGENDHCMFDDCNVHWTVDQDGDITSVQINCVSTDFGPC